MNKQLQQQLQSRIELFANDITALLQGAVANAIAESLAGVDVAKRGAKVAKAPAAKKAKGRPASKAAPAAKKARASRKKGEKRSPAELERLTEALFREISREPDRRIELIGQKMGVPTKDLALPVKKLLDMGRISTKGQRRATTYAPK